MEKLSLPEDRTGRPNKNPEALASKEPLVALNDAQPVSKHMMGQLGERYHYWVNAMNHLQASMKVNGSGRRSASLPSSFLESLATPFDLGFNDPPSLISTDKLSSSGMSHLSRMSAGTHFHRSYGFFPSHHMLHLRLLSLVIKLENLRELTSLRACPYHLRSRR